LTGTALRRHALLLPITVAFLLLALAYSLTTPFFEKTDELYHVAYMTHLADGKGFPAPADPHNPARQEATQPPLYYLIGAALILPIDTGDMASLTELNPYYRPIWDGVYGDNRNRYLHKVNELLPRGGAALAVRVLRCWSIVLGAVAVVATYGIAYTLFPERRWLAAGAVAICAFNPRFLYVSATVNNDVMVAATCALTGLASLRLMRAPHPRAWHVVAVGVALGAALLSKVSAVVVLPVVVIALLYAAHKAGLRSGPLTLSSRAERRTLRPRNPRLASVGIASGKNRPRNDNAAAVAHKASSGGGKTWVRVGLRWSGLVLLCAAAISGWWFARNALLLQGDLTGTAVHVAKWGRRATPLTLQGMWLELQGLEESYWAVFGLNSIPIDRWINLILFGVDRLTVVGAVVLAAKQLTRWRQEREAQVGLLGLGLWVLASLASVGYWIYLMQGVNLGRLLYPAIAPISLLIALAPGQFLPQRWQPAAASVLGMSLFALAVACPWVYIRPNYAPPPILDQAQVGPLTGRLDADFQGQIVLLGYRLPEQETWPGGRMPVTLYYQAKVPFGIDYTVFVHLVDAEGDIITQQDTYPGMGRYPTTMWKPGQIIADTFYLELPGWAPAPGTGTFEVGFYDRETQLRLLVVDEDGQVTGDSVWFDQVRIIAPAEAG
jgi:hypothetical protein